MNEKRILYIDILRIISVFAVILLHVSQPLQEKFGSISINWWWISDIYNSLSRWCVPVMIMISGALLLDPKKEYTLESFFKKRFNRVLIPFIVWTIIYIFWKYRNMIIDGEFPSFILLIRQFIDAKIFYHLWFVYMILVLYALAPIFRVYTKKATLRDIEYFLLIWFISVGIITMARNLFGIKIMFDMRISTDFLGYFIFGYYLHNIDLDKRKKMLIYALAIIGSIITIFGTFVLSEDKGKLVDTFHSYLTPNVIAMSAGVYIFIKDINWEKILGDKEENKGYKGENKLYRFILDISPLTFGIYLIHALILDVLKILKISIESFNPLLSIMIISILVAIISYIIIKYMKKIPIIGKYVS